MPDPGFCPDHNVPWKTVPAGVSRSTGKAYGAFLACPVQGCKRRPVPIPQAQPTVAVSGNPAPAPKTDYSARDRLSAMQTALRAAVDVELQLAGIEGRMASDIEVKRRALRFYERILIPAWKDLPFPDLFDEGPTQ